MRNKRLKQLLTDKGKGIVHADFLDAYNQSVFSNVTPTITSRINASNHYYVAVVEDTPSNEARIY
jgi:hypothetical protein